MKQILFAGAVMFFVSWVLGFFVLGAGPAIHMLLAFSAIFWIQGVITMPRRKSKVAQR